MDHEIFGFGATRQGMLKDEFEETFVEIYEGTLQNIEFAICSVYRKHADIIDCEVLHALDVLIRVYSNEQRGNVIKIPAPAGLSLLVYKAVQGICEWRLGRAEMPFEADDAEFTLQVDGNTVSLEELIMCLKKIRLSVVRWNKRNGRQGYLTFIQDYV